MVIIIITINQKYISYCIIYNTIGNNFYFLNRQSLLSKVDKEDGFDAIISAAMKDNTRCLFKKCKASITTLGQRCDFCSHVYCLSHHIPEVHGCGGQAKRHAQAMIVKDGVLYRGSGRPSKKPDPNKKAYLERKLHKKLTDMTTDRTKAKKKDKH